VVVAKGKMATRDWQQESSHVTSADLLLARQGPANLISFSFSLFSLFLLDVLYLAAWEI
jgi:hypothetical protein